MNKTAKLAFVGILLMVSGCSKQSQVQPAATSREPSVVQAAASAVPTAPQPPAGTSQLGLLTPHPSAGQHLDDRDYLISSDQNYTVGAQIVSGTGEMLFTRLAIKNQTSSPVFFDVKDVTIDAVGREVAAVPRATLAMMVGGNSDTQAVFKKLLSDYWDDRSMLAPNSQEEHFLLAVCGKGCPMPVTVQVIVGGQTYDFAFGDASNAPVSSADAPATPPQPAAPVQAAAPAKPYDAAQEWCERAAQAILAVTKQKSTNVDMELSTNAYFNRDAGNYCMVELIAKINGGKTMANGTDQYTVFAMGVDEKTPTVVINAKATGVNRGSGGEYSGYAGFGNRILVDGNTQQDYERAFRSIDRMMGKH